MYLSASVALISPMLLQILTVRMSIECSLWTWDWTDERTFVLCLTFSGSEGIIRTCVLWTRVPHGNRKADRYCGRKQCDMSPLPPTLHTAFRHCYDFMTAFSALLSRRCMKVAPSVIQANRSLRDFRLPSRCRWGLRSSGLFRSASQ
jgi:hypothetical protein